jgi:predicted MPP superfamily phosphohydrolase
VDMVLCGHTHGGQICLPGGIAIANNSRCPRWSTKGRWQLGKTQGYTSRGLGTSGIKARINCPAEVSVHTLRRSKQE